MTQGPLNWVRRVVREWGLHPYSGGREAQVLGEFGEAERGPWYKRLASRSIEALSGWNRGWLIGSHGEGGSRQASCDVTCGVWGEEEAGACREPATCQACSRSLLTITPTQQVRIIHISQTRLRLMK
jgi:hypothetical protein